MILQTPPSESSRPAQAVSPDLGQSKELFVTAPTRRSRLPGLTASLGLHGLMLAAAFAIPAVTSTPGHTSTEEPRKLSVRFVHLQMPPEYRKRETPGASQTAAARPSAASGALATLASPSVQPVKSPAAHEETSAAAARNDTSEHRQFKLPPTVPVQPVKQTLVQMDVPPTVTLKQETPLPTMLLWNEIPEAPRRRFVSPPVRREVPKVVQSLPAAPAIESPNRELTPAEMNVAAVITVDTPHLIHAPAVASPVTRTGEEPAKEIPQIGIANSAQPSAVNLISLPANPLHSSSMLVLPPANQIAAADAGAAGSKLGHEEGTGAGDRGNGSELRSSSGTAGGGASTAGAPGGSASGSSTGSKTGAEAAGLAREGTAASSTATGGTGTAAAGSKDAGGWSATGSAGVLNAVATPAGVTRIDLPKEGKFGVVVLGSANSASYPESVGALGGKVVYTVYLKVGMRKSWVLQYCLSTAVKETGGGATPVAAPWPFLIMRPDQLNNNSSDYIILHGMLTEAGHFDRLSLLFPEDLEKKELLLSSLKLWAFRPAYRDGVAVPVEVLLIIPNEGE